MALPEGMRQRYTKHLVSLSGAAAQLLITHEYDQQQYIGPPFSVSKTELERHYGEPYMLTLLTTAPIVGGLKGKVAAASSTWLLQKVEP